ncbi:hypothetical protein NECAME_00039 [Necator americanus]|uniref:Uncharacterized protein n=1 Tax=Necator americanus TaxID=51031 RepID=W2TYM7_NECAM|nr:hypothetical protein NECAME_00039 [Necator americanus]ETN87180.1 hypothetical protein NECAME_00039 [Necator americanus]
MVSSVKQKERIHQLVIFVFVIPPRIRNKKSRRKNGTQKICDEDFLSIKMDSRQIISTQNDKENKNPTIFVI